jgi:DNA-binding beta-propeller fold protein YncE
VQVFDRGGEFLFAVGGTLGAGEGEFVTPGGSTVDLEGRVYVTDIGNHRIQVFSSDGQFDSAFGGLGQGALQMDTCSGAAINALNQVIVADTANNRVQVLQVTG